MSHDPEVQMLIPANDVAAPEVTILVPSLNEELTIAQFVSWCQEGIAPSGTSVEILIVDSSDDRTAEIAVSLGARVLKTPKRGLGRAYIDAIPHIRGQFIIMGDADCTYDFRVIKPFIDAWRAGAEFVMGSRFKGSIAPGAMPPLHQYFGTPVTTAILNLMFSSKFSDIHCGMRGITKDALNRMDMRSQGWEYASETVLKSVHMELRTTEVPINFLKDPEGRISHMKRRGWMEPWRAGWMNLRAMLTYGVDFFLLKPGAVLFGIGLVFLIPLTFGPLHFGPISLSLNTMLLRTRRCAEPPGRGRAQRSGNRPLNADAWSQRMRGWSPLDVLRRIVLYVAPAAMLAGLPALIVGKVIFRAPEYDEAEVLHASCLIANVGRIWVDVFEHHSTLLNTINARLFDPNAPFFALYAKLFAMLA